MMPRPFSVLLYTPATVTRLRWSDAGLALLAGWLGPALLGAPLAIGLHATVPGAVLDGAGPVAWLYDSAAFLAVGPAVSWAGLLAAALPFALLWSRGYGGLGVAVGLGAVASLAYGWLVFVPDRSDVLPYVLPLGPLSGLIAWSVLALRLTPDRI